MKLVANAWCFFVLFRIKDTPWISWIKWLVLWRNVFSFLCIFSLAHKFNVSKLSKDLKNMSMEDIHRLINQTGFRKRPSPTTTPEKIEITDSTQKKNATTLPPTHPTLPPTHAPLKPIKCYCSSCKNSNHTCTAYNGCHSAIKYRKYDGKVLDKWTGCMPGGPNVRRTPYYCNSWLSTVWTLSVQIFMKFQLSLSSSLGSRRKALFFANVFKQNLYSEYKNATYN